MTDLAKPQSPPQSTPAAAPAPAAHKPKRAYGAPALTRYGSVDDLVDSGLVGPTASIVPTTA